MRGYCFQTGYNPAVRLTEEVSHDHKTLLMLQLCPLTGFAELNGADLSETVLQSSVIGE